MRNMIRNPKLAKSIADVSWSQFFARLQAKAEEAGRQVVRVNPAYTSQTCSACGHRQPMPLSVRVYECLHCGLILDRDHNGSKNILESFLSIVAEIHVLFLVGLKKATPKSPGLLALLLRMCVKYNPIGFKLATLFRAVAKRF